MRCARLSFFPGTLYGGRGAEFGWRIASAQPSGKYLWDIPRGSACPDLSTLRLTDVQLVLLADYPEELTDEDAIRIGNHTEHALTVFVPGELWRGGAPLARLPEFFRRLNEKIRRFSDDSLAERDKPTYF